MAKKKTPTRKATERKAVSLARAVQGTSLVVLRRGNAIGKAKVLNKTFTISIEEIGPLTLKTNVIETIILKNLPLFPLDVIRTGGNEISGTVTTDPVRIDSPQVGGKIDIPLAKILTISM